jgi:DNA polymerase beta
MDFKAQILDALEKLRQKELANKEPFKVRAYATVIKNLKASDKPINTIDDIKDIKGIGAKIHEKIKEILETGDLKQLERFNEQIKIINELIKVHGIGPVKAKELVEEHGIKSIDDLKENQNLLNDKQKMGLRYVEDFNERIPRKEMEKHDAYIRATIQKINPKLKLEIVGSYRRGAPTSGDIDIIITHVDNPTNYDNIIQDIVTEFKKEKYLFDDFALGTHKYLGVCRLKRHKRFRRIDFLYATKEVWPFSILYFTGSVEFNVMLRKIALDKGLSMSEYGFKKIKSEELLDFKLYTEEDVMNHLGLDYIPPEKRTG